MANTGNSQQQINYGSAANDGQGDPLRTAFIKTDDNFDAIWATGPVGSNITIANNTVQVMNTNGNLVLRPNGVGVIQANASVIPNATDLRDLGTAGLRFRAAYVGTGGLSVTGDVTVTGNVTAGNISYTGNVFVGDLQGSVFADDSTIMVDAVDNSMFADSATFGQATIAGNVSANYFVGNGSLLTGIVSTYGNANVATLLAAFGSNTISTTGNISANYFIGNGALLTGITSSYGNANVVANLAALGSNPISTTGNVSGNFFIGNGSQLTGLSTSSISNGTSNVLIATANGNVTVTSAGNTWNFDTNGNLTLPGNIIAINYLNGNRAFGTVTFNNEAVIGTGTSNTVSGLYLAPDPGSLANNLYLRVRGNILDEATHIHFDTGNNQYFSQFIGDDNKYIQLANTGNIVINTNNYAGNTAQWNFDTTGNLTLPTDGYLVVTTGIIGSGASPAPSLSGFSSIATTGSPGNISASGNLLVSGYANITGNINGSNAIFSGNVTGNTAGFAIGYLNIPQVSFTGNATLAAGDAGKHYYSTLATANTLTIANNTSVSWSVGTAITVVNRGSGNITVAQGSGVSLYLAGNSSAGNRTISTYGMATLLNVEANTWMINGTGVS